MSQVRKWKCSEVKLHTCSPRIGQQYNWDERGRLVSELDHCALGVNPGLGPVCVATTGAQADAGKEPEDTATVGTSFSTKRATFLGVRGLPVLSPAILAPLEEMDR